MARNVDLEARVQVQSAGEARGALRRLGVGTPSQSARGRLAGGEQNAILVARIAANVVQLDVSLKRTPAVRTYAATLLVCARTDGFDGAVAMDASGVDWMLMRLLSCLGPPCQNFPPSSAQPTRRSGSSLRQNATSARRTAISRCYPMSGGGGLTPKKVRLERSDLKKG